MVEILAEYRFRDLLVVVYAKDGKPLDAILYTDDGSWMVEGLTLDAARHLGQFLTEHCRVDDDPITALLDEAREANDG